MKLNWQKDGKRRNERTGGRGQAERLALESNETKEQSGKSRRLLGEQHWPEARETISKVGPVSVA